MSIYRAVNGASLRRTVPALVREKLDNVLSEAGDYGHEAAGNMHSYGSGVTWRHACSVRCGSTQAGGNEMRKHVDAYGAQHFLWAHAIGCIGLTGHEHQATGPLYVVELRVNPLAAPLKDGNFRGEVKSR
jgi:hypothetical protein